MRDRRGTCLAAAVIGLCGLATALHGYEDGAPAGHTGGFGEPSCIACHSDGETNDSRGELAVAGLPAACEPGQAYPLRVTLRHPALASGGLQLSIRNPDGSQAGRFSSDAGRLTVAGLDGVRYLQHRPEGREARGGKGRIHWKFSWQAPAAGADELLLNVAANAANDDDSALGDHIFVREYRFGPCRSGEPGDPLRNAASPDDS